MSGPSNEIFTCDVPHILQATVNRSKGNRTEISKSDLIQKSSYCRVSGIYSSPINCLKEIDPPELLILGAIICLFDE